MYCFYKTERFLWEVIWIVLLFITLCEDDDGNDSGGSSDGGNDGGDSEGSSDDGSDGGDEDGSSNGGSDGNNSDGSDDGDIEDNEADNTETEDTGFADSINDIENNEADSIETEDTGFADSINDIKDNEVDNVDNIETENTGFADAINGVEEDGKNQDIDTNILLDDDNADTEIELVETDESTNEAEVLDNNTETEIEPVETNESANTEEVSNNGNIDIEKESVEMNEINDGNKNTFNNSTEEVLITDDKNASDNNLKLNNNNDTKNGQDTKEDRNNEDNKDDIYNKETGYFNRGCFGEIKYDSDILQQNIYITKGMKNADASKATQSFSNNLRSTIQENAIENKLSEEKDFFKQFGCDKETPSSIRTWFSESEIYTLHETKEHTIQIMDSKIHSSFHHAGGVSQEKWEMISAESRNR